MTPNNVLLIVLDAVRKDHLSPYGYDRPTTPNLDEFAEEATVYDSAIAAAPWTPTSHAAMFTGQYPSNNGVFGRTPNLAPDRPHVAEALSERGYRTFGFSNSYHTSPNRGFDRGFEYYHDILSLPRFADRMYEPSLDFARHVVDYFLKEYDDSSYQLRRLRTQLDRTDGPFFGFINCNSAHSPYDPPERFKTEFESYFDEWDAVDEDAARAVSEDAYRWMLGEVEMTDAEWDLLRCWYDGEIRYLDFLLGSLFDDLRERGLYDETAIIVTSDHGEQFGEDGLIYHQFSLSERLINVPLLVKWPEGVEPSTDGGDGLVSLTDIAPTAIDLAGESPPAAMDGRSLLSEASHDIVFAEYAGPGTELRERFDGSEFTIQGLQAARTPDHKLVRATDGSETLYRVSESRESETEDTAVRERLSERLSADLAPLPSEDTSSEVADHVADHLEKMGYR